MGLRQEAIRLSLRTMTQDWFFGESHDRSTVQGQCTWQCRCLGVSNLSLSLFQALTLSQHFPPRAMKCGRFIASCQLASASESRAKEATLFVHRPSFRPNRGEEQRCAAVSCLSACRSLSFPLLLADKQPATAWETRLCGSVRAALDVVHASFSKTQGRWPP